MPNMDQQIVDILSQYDDTLPEHAEDEIAILQDQEDAMTPDSEIPPQLRGHIEKKEEKTSAWQAGYHTAFQASGLT